MTSLMMSEMGANWGEFAYGGVVGVGLAHEDADLGAGVHRLIGIV